MAEPTILPPTYTVTVTLNNGTGDVVVDSTSDSADFTLAILARASWVMLASIYPRGALPPRPRALPAGHPNNPARKM